MLCGGGGAADDVKVKYSDDSPLTIHTQQVDEDLGSNGRFQNETASVLKGLVFGKQREMERGEEWLVFDFLRFFVKIWYNIY